MIEHVGLPGLIYLIEEKSGASGTLVFNYVSKLLAEFLQIDEYEIFKNLDRAKTLYYNNEFTVPETSVWDSIREIAKAINDDISNWVQPTILAASLLGAISTSPEGVPIKFFSLIGVDEARFIIVLSNLLTRILPITGRDAAYKIRLSFDNGLKIVSEEEIVCDKNHLIFEKLFGEAAPHELVVNTLYINRIISSPSDTFLHGVLGLIMLSKNLKTAASLAERLRELDESSILSFMNTIAFYIGIPGVKKKFRRIRYEKENLHRYIPITDDILSDAYLRYTREGKRYYSGVGISPITLIKRASHYKLSIPEAKALALVMTVPMRKKNLKRAVDEDSIKVNIGDALSALYKGFSYKFSSEHAPNIPNDIVQEDGLRRVEEKDIYLFLRDNFDSFSIKFMEDVIFELPFRLWLLKQTYEEGKTTVTINATDALTFIHSLGTPMRKQTGYKLLTFIADAIQTGRLSSAELYYEDGRTRLKYSRGGSSMAPSKRILETNFPRLSDMFAFSRFVLGILDRNSGENDTVRSAYKAQKLVRNFIKQFTNLWKKSIKKAEVHRSAKKRFLYLSRVHPLVLFSIPIAIVVSHSGESLTEVLRYIDFRGPDPSKASLIIHRGSAQDLFMKAIKALEIPPVTIDQTPVYVFKVLASTGLTISVREDVAEKDMRPLKFDEAVDIIFNMKSTVSKLEVLNTLLSIAERMGYVRIYGLKDTVVTLNYYNGSAGLINTSKFFDIADIVSSREVLSFSPSFIEELSESRILVRDDYVLNQYFAGFFKLISEGYLPLIATKKGNIYIRLLRYS